MKSHVVLCFGLAFWLAAADVSQAQEWTRFRGPNGTGIGDADSVPLSWTEKDFLWKSDVTGIGHSSPVAWAEKVFVTSADAATGERLVECFHLSDGKRIWQKKLPGEKYHTHLRNSFATSTPTVDSERLYTAWATPLQLAVIALDHAGNVAWQADLGPFKSQHGFGASPIRFEDLLILPNEQDGGGSLLALEAATGKVGWQTPRQGKNATYSTPCVYEGPDGLPQIIFTNWQHGITSIDPATGQKNWELSVFEVTKNERAIASPVIAGDLILGTCGFVTAQKHLVAVRPGDRTSNRPPQEVWRLEQAVAYLPTPLVLSDRVFLCSEKGIATYLEAATGRVIWQERLGGSFSASPVCIQNRIYCTSESGEVMVLAVADELEKLAVNPLGEVCQSTPAVVGGRLLFRTEHSLIAIGSAPARAPR